MRSALFESGSSYDAYLCHDKCREPESTDFNFCRLELFPPGDDYVTLRAVMPVFEAA